MYIPPARILGPVHKTGESYYRSMPDSIFVEPKSISRKANGKSGWANQNNAPIPPNAAPGVRNNATSAPAENQQIPNEPARFQADRNAGDGKYN